MMIDIIGAGIGGLTTAIALEQKGIKTRVFEQATEIKPVGAGIILANNAMQVYEKLGLRSVIEKHGNHIASMNITNKNLKPISKVDLSFFEKKHEVKNIAIHRGVLQQILIDALKTTELHLNHCLQTIIKKDDGYTLVFENGAEIESLVLLGADGIQSKVQQILFSKNTLRNAHQICWRGITDFKLPLEYQHQLNEAWGRTARFGFVKIASNKVYWYALKSYRQDADEYNVNGLQNYFEEYNTVIQNIIASTKKEKIHTATISDFKPTNNWYKSSVCLLGDAAHAMTPNLGQGACQAIEDAYVLSECISKYGITIAFKEYEKIRLPKAHRVVKTSWTIGKLSHITNPILIALRNQLMRLVPSSVNRKQSAQIFKISNV